MIEILILYVINKREKTLYAIRKEIFDIFGAYTKPSIGTLYPALKRLLEVNAVSVTERFSDGGRKSSYYSMTKKGLEYFKEQFFSTASENPSLFSTHLHVRFGLMGLLNIEERKEFISDSLKKVELNIIEIENRLKDEYLGLDYFQTQIMEKTLADYKSLLEFMKHLKVENDS